MLDKLAFLECVKCSYIISRTALEIELNCLDTQSAVAFRTEIIVIVSMIIYYFISSRSITNIPNNNHAYHAHQISSGCDVEDSYAAIWVQDTNETALVDTRNNTIGVVTGIQSPKQMIWVDYKSSPSQMTPSKPPKIPSSGISHGPGVALTFLALLVILLT